MTNSDPLDPDNPEEYDPMAMSRDYHDAPYIIPGLRIRRIKPSTRRHPRRVVDQVVGRALDSTVNPESLKALNPVQTGRKFVGVLRQNGPIAGVLRQKSAPPDDQAVQAGTPQKVATPPEGAQMPLKGVEDFGGMDARGGYVSPDLNAIKRGCEGFDHANPDSGAL